MQASGFATATASQHYENDVELAEKFDEGVSKAEEKTVKGGSTHKFGCPEDALLPFLRLELSGAFLASRRRNRQGERHVAQAAKAAREPA